MIKKISLRDFYATCMIDSEVKLIEDTGKMFTYNTIGKFKDIEDLFNKIDEKTMKRKVLWFGFTNNVLTIKLAK